MTALRREPFWHRDARGLRLFVSLERGSHIVRIGEFEAFRQHRGILDRLHRALRHVGEHRMRGIAHQRHASDRPSRERVAIIARPTIGRIDRSDDLANLRMPSLEFLERSATSPFAVHDFDAPFAGSKCEARVKGNRLIWAFLSVLQ